jgi:hypothetical protein
LARERVVVGWLVKEAKNTLREGRTKNKKSSRWIAGRKGESKGRGRIKQKRTYSFHTFINAIQQGYHTRQSSAHADCDLPYPPFILFFTFFYYFSADKLTLRRGFPMLGIPANQISVC